MKLIDVDSRIKPRRKRSTRKGNATTLDIETVFLILFLVGFIAIPLLYWLSNRDAGPD
jgi:hypothetical protein